ncbi:hypothetical protein NSERUTF1_3330 [Nocardia seriolae]|nr:hypothetical protein NSERUTF1_3330 [Nocardia seriolae]
MFPVGLAKHINGGPVGVAHPTFWMFPEVTDTGATPVAPMRFRTAPRFVT